MDRRLAPIAIAGAALYYTYGVIGHNARLGIGTPSTDIYAYSVPNFRYAVEAFQRGDGIFWNALQNCGQPFFGLSSSGLLYPPNLLYWLERVETALLLSVLFHLVVAGIGAYRLCRELGLGEVASICGSLAFQLGSSCLALASWNPALLAPYVWLPWCLLFTERALTRPSTSVGIGIGSMFTLQVFAGFPQTLFITGQLVALRVLWELASRRRWLSRRSVVALGIGALLPIFLGAAQLLPATESAAQSLRAEGLEAEDIGPMGRSQWDAFRHNLESRRVGAGNLFTAVGTLLVGFAFVSNASRRIAAFYLAAGALHFLLAFSAPLYELYATLPIVRSFRLSTRLLWVTSFASSVLIAIAVDAIVKRPNKPSSSWQVFVWPTAAILGFALLAPDRLRATEAVMIAVAFPVAAWALLRDRGRRVAAIAVPIVLLSNLLVVSTSVHLRSLDDIAPLHSEREVFAYVREQQSLQERMLQLGPQGDFSVMPKSASLFGVPSLMDYEPLASGRYARLFVWLYSGKRLTSARQFISPRLGPEPNRPLLNLTAGRYLIAKGERAHEVALRTRPPLEPMWHHDDVGVYLNRDALPRAYYVPQVRVVADPEVLLAQLASGRHRPRRAALIETPPHDGFLGLGPSGRGTVRFATDRSEQMEIGVDASQPGFLVVTDQFYPGWEATVDGALVSIERANYAFRLVRVPQGRSTVEFGYRPRSVAIGIAVSAATAAAVLFYGLRRAVSRMR